jgi:integrase
MAKRFRAKQRSVPAPKRRVPKYCGPHQTGQAYSIWPAGTAKAGRPRYHGLFGTPESRENYRRWLAELRLDATGTAGTAEVPLLTVAELWEKWLDWVDERKIYAKHGKETGTVDNFKAAMSWLQPLYASMLVIDFGPYHLAAVREKMADAQLARSTINGYLAKIKQVWRRAAAWGLISKENYVALEACEPLRRNEGGRETDPVLSVDEKWIQAVTAWVTPPIRAMLDICCWSGCRIGEARIMRTCDIRDEDPIIPPSLQGKCWVYRPSAWKSEHHHASRIVFLGPQAQAIVEPWLRPAEPEAFLFSPYEAMVMSNRKKALKHGKFEGRRRPSKPVDRPYSESAVGKAIDRVCIDHNLPHWHPHQLRHLAATRLAAKYGLQITQVLLGHANITTTLKYVDPNVITKDDREKYAAAIRAIAEHG